MTMGQPRRKRIRLDLETYAVPGTVWHVSPNTIGRLPAFRNPEMAAIAVESLHFQCDKAKAQLLVFASCPTMSIWPSPLRIVT